MADRQENKKTVVVVDDEPIIRMDLGQMLEELNYEVVAEGADGFDAVELCRKKNPDVVLLDLEMPVFDGMTAAETIINESLAGCVVICTAFAIGVSGYIVKPVEARNLRPTIEMAYAQGRRLAKQKLAIGEANRRLEENRVIERAKGLLARSKYISEMDAYRKMQKTAMEKRAPLVSVARAIIRVESQRDEANQAKKWLMRERRMTEQEAYRYLVKGAEKAGLTVSAFAKQLLEEEA